MADGYILVASGTAQYFEMAAMAAKSIRFFDPDRRICLACDQEAGIAPEHRGFFDDVVLLEHSDIRRGTEHHLYLNRIAPYDRTLYVDADCLMANARIHDVWARLTADYHITFPGRKLTEGNWRVDIAMIREALGIDYVVQLNGGVFYFDRSPEATTFFATAQDLFEKRGREISVRHNKGKGIANEPIWGSTMALTQTPIFPLSEQLNVSTLRCERWEVDEAPSIRMWKDRGVYQPVVCHFLGLGGPKCPNDLYETFLSVIDGRTLEAPVSAPGPHVAEPAGGA